MARKRAVPLDVQVIALTEEVRKLRSELWSTRRDLIGLMKSDIEALLTSYYSVPMPDGPYPWADQLVEKLLEHATARSRHDMGGISSLSDRALCPLCGGGSDNPYGEEGFAYPEGLRRHLAGSYNARQCAVVKAAIELAWDHSERKKVGTSHG